MTAILSSLLAKFGGKALAAGLGGLLLAGLVAFGWYRIEALTARNERLTADYATAMAANATMRIAFNHAKEAQKQADKLEVKYHDQAREINNLAADNRRLADELGGLRDPYAAGDGNGNTGDAPGCAPDRAPAGQLSKEASRFLLGLAEEADRMSAYAWTCYRWVNRERPGVMGEPE
jgi:hypothetical protein